MFPEPIPEPVPGTRREISPVSPGPLRSDLHILFDRGYLSVTPDLEVAVSHRIREQFENGPDYYALQGRRLIELPSQPVERPNRELLEWHNQKVFVA